MVHFVGAGPGAPDLITLRGQMLLQEADQVIYAGSLVNPALLTVCSGECRILNSARMTLEEVIAAVQEGEALNWSTVRLHTGDPSLYGAIHEQMARLDVLHIPYDVTPGVSSFCAAAAALRTEYTLPGVSQSLILSRMAGRTPVPGAESVPALASHGASMVLFLSAGMLPSLQAELLAGAYRPETPCAIVHKVSWPEERILRCTLQDLAVCGQEAGITGTALILVGDFLEAEGERSFLYDPSFTTAFREGKT